MAAGMAITAAIAATALRHLEGHMEEDAAIRLLRRIARDLLGATGALVVLTAAAAIAAAGDMEAIAERELIVFDERRLRSGRRFLLETEPAMFL
jgi:hypothetical protein